MDLTGRVVLITGASRGIGRACALKMAELGACIAVNYSTNKEKAEEVVAEIKKMGKEACAIQADVTVQNEVEEMVKYTIKYLGSLDILVNNAGITRDTFLLRMNEKDWNIVLNTNLNGVFLVTKAASKYMIKQRYGKIINISSVVGIAANAGQANYAASKAGVIGFSKSIAKEFAPRNIMVNVVVPGFIDTDMTNNLTEQQKAEILKQIPLKRYGKPEDVANVVAFLASKESNYITGQIIHIDGGMNM
ncbi:MAG: 3-oxoacyl-[acyl-carrier-protein] reductase [Clostridiales bacterium]|nr:3-oxoacyl-[acyl-carrier-protein] reductase [Clostridiales bacterium]